MSPKDGNSNSSGQVNVVPSPSSSSSSQPPSSVVVVVPPQQQSGIAADPSVVLLGVADQQQQPGQLMTPQQQQQQQLQVQMQLQQQQLQQQVLKPHQTHPQQQQQLIEVQGNSLDDGTDSLDELTSASNSNAISALLDSNTTPSPSNDTNTNASLDSLLGDGSKISTTSTTITTTCTTSISTITTNPLVLSNTMSDNATSNVISTGSVEVQGSGAGGNKPNLLVAANIANTFINLAGVNPSNEAGVPQQQQQQVVPQPPQQPGQPVAATHVMKTFTIGTNRGSIFVPNVLATNIAPHFTVHHHQFGLRNGPAPNVTVNPNGNFNTNSSAVIRPGFTHIRPFLPQSSNINFNIIGNSSAIQSPILAASLQTINKIAQQQQQQQVQHPIMQHHHARGANKIINVCPDGSQKILLATTPVHLQQQQQQQVVMPVDRQQQPGGAASPSYSPQRSQTPCSSRSITPNMANANDQQIRVLTPSEIMRTLPSLDASSYENEPFGKSHTQGHTITTNPQDHSANSNMTSAAAGNTGGSELSFGSILNRSTSNSSTGNNEQSDSIGSSVAPITNTLTLISNNNNNSSNNNNINNSASYNETSCPSSTNTTTISTTTSDTTTTCLLGASASATSTTISCSSSTANTTVTTTTTTTTTTVVTTTSTTAPETVRTMKASKRNRFELWFYF